MLAAAFASTPAIAATGGASADPDQLSADASAPTGATLAIGTPVATASANGITISSKAAALLKQRATVTGLAPANLGSVSIEALDPKLATWAPVATATIDQDGTFAAAWRPRTLGAQQLRAVAATTATRSTGSAPQVAVTVYRPGLASWYAPSSNGGSKTACGVRLTKTTIGVANKTLPCGTQVELYYHGKKIVAPVIDRGPFIDGRTWDLTKATHKALGGLDGLITVGALTVTTVPKLKTPFQAPAL
ncbi:septal ring lytic transglycosylase RlpA family protein [Conexibacter sp. CPCC 206217]|uniref:septal ring lytic transglycosylase RlpA family protein n=1 Tax=Conexibacter sp. CPCC 206217 TaxID=3064574 RepID=UPI00272736C8|nr:septal ring lytic transglycosylase RlpA family protein [Conexibacter sp. CPCC 206217]MDO8213027.1 septal ring lytic transglycosylase RlpA family protein [Conexibacter sp. CPCC 206217]